MSSLVSKKAWKMHQVAALDSVVADAIADTFTSSIILSLS